VNVWMEGSRPMTPGDVEEMVEKGARTPAGRSMAVDRCCSALRAYSSGDVDVR
jgi:hypothetical protein